jgi:serine/threonine-protein kinase
MVGKDGSPLGIVHRDVSPQNIFVLYDGGVKVVDFGIAKAVLRNTQTQTGTLKGKFAYMSPEQVLGVDLGGRRIIKKLGTVLWECLVGRGLFAQEGHLQQLEAIVREDVLAPATLNPDIPAQLSNIAKKALTRDREKRYQSAAELRQALADYLKENSLEADTIAIERFLRQLLGKWIEIKQGLIERAHDAAPELKPSEVTDLSKFLTSDHDFFVPDSKALLKHTVVVGSQPKEHFWRKPVPLVVLGGVLAIIVLVIILFLPEDQVAKQAPSPSSDQGEDAISIPVYIEMPADEPEKDKPNKSAKKKKKRRKRTPSRWRGERQKKPGTKAMPPGKLRLITVPWADIYYKGKKIGQTPLVDVKLPAGEVKLRAVNRAAGIDQFITVSIKSGERVTKRLNFKRGTTSVPLP